MDREIYPLELNIEQKMLLTEAVLNHIFEFYKKLDKLPIAEPRWAEVKNKAKEIIEYAPPQRGMDFKSILDKLFSEYIPPAMNFPSPGFMGFMPSSALYQSALADFIAMSTNRHVGHSYTTPFLTQLESNVIRWFANMIGYPKSAKGILTSGGSIANLTAIILARSIILGGNISEGIIYMSDQVHHSIQKGASGAGIMSNRQRIIPSDKSLKIDTKLLKEAIQKDKKNGKIPFLIIGNAGTTNAGTIDSLEELAQISREHNAWFRVDAAYGGFFNITDEGKSKLKGIENADSVIMNPLKSLFLPLGFGSLLVKEGSQLDKVFSHGSDYFPDKGESEDFWDPANMSLELSRPFRGLSVWLPMKMHGLSKFEAALEEKMALSKKLSDMLQSDPGWDVLYPPELSLMAISCKIDGLNTSQTSEANKNIIEEVNRSNRAYLTGAKIKDRFLIRVCVLSFRTHEKQVNDLYEELNKARNKICGDHR